VGASVAAGMGEDVGSGVGAAVGRGVGEGVGASVGAGAGGGIGDGVGAAVSTGVGEGVGTRVGAATTQHAQAYSSQKMRYLVHSVECRHDCDISCSKVHPQGISHSTQY